MIFFISSQLYYHIMNNYSSFNQIRNFQLHYFMSVCSSTAFYHFTWLSRHISSLESVMQLQNLSLMEFIFHWYLISIKKFKLKPDSVTENTSIILDKLAKKKVRKKKTLKVKIRNRWQSCTWAKPRQDEEEHAIKNRIWH